ncbi:MAG TPA: hypothetical protein VKZ97_10550 [Flavobacteriaceae bacterium]|nr:hypothetical protein [Flavobacteriaceae bacterium]
MKRILLVVLTFAALVSCSLNDDSDNTYYEFVPVEPIDFPTEFELDSLYNLKLKYYRPTSCHAFNDIYYAHDSVDVRTIAIVTTVFADNNNCEPLVDVSHEVNFDFKALDIESYTFKFWQGEDETGEDQYITLEVPVVE